jgi:hypothetical protein
MADAESGTADASTIAMDVAVRLIKVSPRRLQQLVADGWIPRAGHGRYTVVGVVHGYIAYRDDLEQRRSAAISDTDLRAVRRREIEQRMAIRDRDLIDIVKHDAVFDEAIGMLKAELIGLPARITRNIEFRRLVTTLQWLTIIPMALQPISRWFCEAAYLAGTLPMPFVPVTGIRRSSNRSTRSMMPTLTPPALSSTSTRARSAAPASPRAVPPAPNCPMPRRMMAVRMQGMETKRRIGARVAGG